MTPGQKLALQSFSPRVFLDELLREKSSEMTPRGVYKAVMAVTGNKDQAEAEMASKTLQDEYQKKLAQQNAR